MNNSQKTSVVIKEKLSIVFQNALALIKNIIKFLITVIKYCLQKVLSFFGLTEERQVEKAKYNVYEIVAYNNTLVRSNRNLLIVLFFLVIGMLNSGKGGFGINSFFKPRKYIAKISLNDSYSTDFYATDDFEDSVLRPVLKDKRVAAVILNLESPGGTVVRAGKLAQMIEKIAKEKMVISYVNTYCASACYYIASYTHKIYANSNWSLVGSIGARRRYYNLHEIKNKNGIYEKHLASGYQKIMGVEPLTKELEAEAQAEVDKNGKQFVDHVALKRKLTKSQVEKIQKAGVYLSEEALELNLIDGIKDIEEIKQYLIDEKIVDSKIKIIEIKSKKIEKAKKDRENRSKGMFGSLNKLAESLSASLSQDNSPAQQIHADINTSL